MEYRSNGVNTKHRRGLMNEAVKIGSYEDDDDYGNEKDQNIIPAQSANFQRQLLSIPSKSRDLFQSVRIKWFPAKHVSSSSKTNVSS